MDFEEDERALLDAHLELDTSNIGWWIYISGAGAVLCALAVVLYITGQLGRPSALLFFIVGLVVIDLGMDFRRKRVMARILQKYQGALGEQSGEDTEEHSEEG